MQIKKILKNLSVVMWFQYKIIKELEEKLEITTNLKNQLLENLSRRSSQ